MLEVWPLGVLVLTGWIGLFFLGSCAVLGMASGLYTLASRAREGPAIPRRVRD
jgi:hypothetical protein